MAASSQYHRGATTPTSHYHSLPSSHEHLYANLATTWSSSHGFSRPTPPSALLPRFSSPVQRPFAGHYFEYGAPSEYVNVNQQQQQQQQQQSPPSSWPASHYLRPGQQPPWDEAPQHDGSSPARQLQNASDTHVAAPNAPNAPPFPQQPLNSAPVARLLNYPSHDLHVTQAHPHPHPSHAPSPAPLSWPAGPDAVLSPSHPATALSAHVILAHESSLGSSAWGILGEHVSAIEPAWSQVDAQPGHLEDVQQHHDVAHPHHEVTVPLSQGSRARRAASKKTIARVPAAFVERQEKNKISKRQGPLSEASRQKTHQMRKDKTTCLRCRFYKSGCDYGDPCQKCLKTEGNARSFKLPCIRERLEDATLVRHCNGRSNQDEAEFLAYDWATGCQLYDMEIIWNLPGYGPITPGRPMRITFREYHPQRPFLDTTTNMWSNTDGQVKVVEQPPYAVYDTASLIPSFERYFSHLQPAIERWIFDRVQHDELALLTYNEVLRLREGQASGTRSLLDLVMRIQCLSVVSQGYGTVWSNNIPGIQTVDFGELGSSEYEAYNRNSRDRPLPGAINHQMDVAALKYLKKLERQCVKELSAMMFKSKIKPWYELFLALYVLFWNMEYIHRGASKYIISKNGTAIQTHVSSVVSTQIKKWDWAFQVLNHHWIAVLRGYMPFKLARENPEELREKGHLDSEGFQYVMKVAHIFDQIGFGRSTAPFVASTQDSMSSEWIRTLFKEAGA